MTPYQQRVLKQIQDWAAGKVAHNDIDNECCPDFSCCNAGLFEKDDMVRRAAAEKYRARVQGGH